jgi:hypothetical protein
MDEGGGRFLSVGRSLLLRDCITRRLCEFSPVRDSEESSLPPRNTKGHPVETATVNSLQFAEIDPSSLSSI